MPEQPDLSVVIPTWNDADTIVDLVEAFLALPGLDVEVVVVDDASTDDTVARLAAVDHPGLLVIPLPINGGAGIARNVGFEKVSGRATLFFDGDDTFEAEALCKAVAALRTHDADLAMLPYRYRRGNATQYEGMNSFDEAVWEQYVSGKQLVTRLEEVPRLLGFSNYPWNKVLATERYRETGLVFGHTRVNNDILGHWMSLLHSRRIVLIDDVVCTHVVSEGGKNLTNQRSRVRLTLFDALDETYSMIESLPDLRNRYSHHYWDFVLRVTGWAADRVPPDLMPEFNIRLQEHLLRVDLADFMRIRTRRSAALSERIIRRSLA